MEGTPLLVQQANRESEYRVATTIGKIGMMTFWSSVGLTILHEIGTSLLPEIREFSLEGLLMAGTVSGGALTWVSTLYRSHIYDVSREKLQDTVRCEHG